MRVTVRYLAQVLLLAISYFLLAHVFGAMTLGEIRKMTRRGPVA